MKYEFLITRLDGAPPGDMQALNTCGGEGWQLIAVQTWRDVTYAYLQRPLFE